MLDLGLPFLPAIWQYLEEDFLRLGINGVLGNDPNMLCQTGKNMLRILRPGFRPEFSGYAREGLIPVLGSFAECLGLSNLAQMSDQRLSFLLRARSAEPEFGAGDWGLESLCQRLYSLPMLDLHGFYVNYRLDDAETAYLKNLLQRVGGGSIFLPTAFLNHNTPGFRSFITSEYLSLHEGCKGNFPLEIGFWAFPLKRGPDYMIFHADLGRLHGLQHNFPVQVGGKNARVLALYQEHCELVIDGSLNGPYPVKGFLSGGASHDPVDIRLWNKDDLISLLAHWHDNPVYLATDKKVIEVKG